jgi:abhydrolase domain-containing protein 4
MNKIENINNENNMSQIETQTGIVANNYSNGFSLWKPSTWFSLTWTLNELKIHELETEMLSCLKSPFKRFFVILPKMNANIWTIGANTDINRTPVVFIHGFCGGIGLWIHNIDPISQNRPFYAFDLLGFGRSSRPKFTKDPIEVENQFVESIEEWREEMKIDKMILLGHSFGGYLASSYALKYPKYIEKLILADPW